MTDQTQTSLRAVIDTPGDGRVMMAGFPGLDTGVDGSGYIDPDQTRATLHAITSRGATLLVVLTEEPELPPQAYAVLTREAEARKLDLLFLPILDYHAPDAATLRRWHDLMADRQDAPDAGGCIAFCCQYGAGRSGAMAAYTLMRTGLSLDDAVTAVRAQFSEAIESEAQMAWLEMVSSRLKDDSQTLDLDSDTPHR